MKRKLEALLFVAGEEGIEKKTLQATLTCSQVQLAQWVAELNIEYTAFSFHIIDKGSYYAFVTKQEVQDVVTAFANEDLNAHLSKACLESLAIIAYEQPITKAEIDEIRGVHSSHRALQKLLSYQLIEEKGRLDQLGRPKTYGTTAYFLQYFQLESLEALPPLPKMEAESTALFE